MLWIVWCPHLTDFPVKAHVGTVACPTAFRKISGRTEKRTQWLWLKFLFFNPHSSFPFILPSPWIPIILNASTCRFNRPYYMKKRTFVAGKCCMFKFSKAVRTGKKKWDYKKSSKFTHVGYVQRELLSFVTVCICAAVHLAFCSLPILIGDCCNEEWQSQGADERKPHGWGEARDLHE